jgi:hypothetical protein
LRDATRAHADEHRKLLFRNHVHLQEVVPRLGHVNFTA